MPQINLLPWREQERKRRQHDFMIALAAAFVAAAVVVSLVWFVFVQMFEAQRDRNHRLQTEIAVLERSITEIDGLERQKERLLARMEIIEELQRSRPEVVHLFEEITRQVPEGVYLNRMTQQGDTIELKGIAQSSTRVSALMRRADESVWLTDPTVTKVETTQFGSARQAEFVVTLKQTSPEAYKEQGL